MTNHDRCDSDVRLERIRDALIGHQLDAVVCSHNLNVLLLSGYWPVTGTAIAVATAEPRVVLLVPEDAEHLAARGWADRIHTFQPASLDSMQNAWSGLSARLKEVLPSFLRPHARVGHEAGIAHLPASYASQHVLDGLLPALLREVLPGTEVLGADNLLQGLRMRPTAWEIERIRTACDIAGQAFCEGARSLCCGMPETEAVLPFQHALGMAGTRHEEIARSDGFFYCMSGVNAAQAYAAFQQSRRKPLQRGEPILIHCNSYADGYWTDLTRTYVLGPPDARLRGMFNVIAAARDAAFDAVRPGARTCDVDRAARTVLGAAGYGKAFRHSTGHGVGFSAIDHDAWPRIHPCSTEILEEDMVFNIEPGIYIEGYGGARDCNMVAVTAHGHELLSPFQPAPKDWCIDI